MEFNTERPGQLKIDIRTVALMQDDDIRWLVAWSAIKSQTFPHFAPWLQAVLSDELTRRDDPSREAEMIALPRMNAMELSDFVQGSYVLARLPLNERQAAFADKISMLVLADTVAALEHFEIGTVVT